MLSKRGYGIHTYEESHFYNAVKKMYTFMVYTKLNIATWYLKTYSEFYVVAKRKQMETGKITEFYTSLLTHNDCSQEVGFNLKDNRKIETLYISAYRLGLKKSFINNNRITTTKQ